MGELVVAFPDLQTRERVLPAPDGVDYVVWDVTDPPLDRGVDLLVLRYMVPASELELLHGLDIGAVQSQTLGYDGVADHLPVGLTYCNAVDVHEASTAELALALILATQRGLPALGVAQAEGRWAHAQYPGLAGRRVVLVGVGGVGHEIEKRLDPFDVDLVRVGRSAREGVAAFEELPGLLPTAEIVILAIPLTAESRQVVSRDFLSLLAPGALLVNVSRGPIVDTDALVDAVRGRGIRAALDVTDPEPLPPGHPLWHLPGVLITPHVGGHTGAMAGRVDRLVRDQVHRLLVGQPLRNVVLPHPV